MLSTANLPTWTRHLALPAVFGLALFCMLESVSVADDGSLDQILEKHQRATFEEVLEYVKAHPQAVDADRAYTYLFRAGLIHEMAAEALPSAEVYLAREQQNPAVAELANRVRCMGLAELKDFDGALAAYDSILAATDRLNSENALRMGCCWHPHPGQGRVRSLTCDF